MNAKTGEHGERKLSNGGGWCGKFLRACKNRRIICIKGTGTFEVVRFNEEGEFGDYIKSPKNFDYMDVCVFGKQRSLVAGIWNGHSEMHLYEIKFIGEKMDCKLKLKHQFKDTLHIGAPGHGEAVTACPKSNFIAVHLRAHDNSTGPQSLRIMGYNEKTHKLLTFHNLDVRLLNQRKLYTIKFARYFGNDKLVLASCNRDAEGKVISFCLDLSDRRVKLIERNYDWNVAISGFFKIVDAGNGRVGMINNNSRIFLMEYFMIE